MCHSLEATKDVLGNVCASYSIPSSLFYSRWANVLGNLAYLLVSRTMPWLVEGRLQPRSFLREVGYLASKHARGCPLPPGGLGWEQIFAMRGKRAPIVLLGAKMHVVIHQAHPCKYVYTQPMLSPSVVLTIHPKVEGGRESFIKQDYVEIKHVMCTTSCRVTALEPKWNVQ